MPLPIISIFVYIILYCVVIMMFTIHMVADKWVHFSVIKLIISKTLVNSS